MLETLPVKLIVGTVLGFLSGLGIGGGSLLIIWLTAVMGMDPSSARSINLLFFIPGAVIAICFRRRQGDIHWDKVLPPAIAGCIAAGIFSGVAMKLDTDIIKKVFGVILIGAGVREVLWKRKS